MLDILSIIPGKKKRSASGWHTFNGICCQHRGHNRDTRNRCGVIISDDDKWNLHCFNCQFKCGYSQGKTFSKNLKSLLTWCGVDQDQIERWSFESFRQQSVLDRIIGQKKKTNLAFKTLPLPENSRLIDSDSIEDKIHRDYLASRSLSIDDYDFRVVDGESRQRIIIPYYHKGEIVGNTSRFYDARKPKYISEQQKGYVFNLDNQPQDWAVCILVEGQFDALSIGGCAYMGSNISDEQALLLAQLRKTIIVVPDRDRAGMEVCTRAIDLGYKVSIPEWHDSVKDVNDAVNKYGKLPTLMSILSAASGSKILMEMKRKKFK